MDARNPKQKQAKIRLFRLDLVGKYYKQGYSYRKILALLEENHNIIIKSANTIKLDVQLLLKEWQESRIAETDKMVAIEIQKIYEINQELWSSWEKSKLDHTLKTSKQKMKTIPLGDNGEMGLTPEFREDTRKDEINYGDPRYMQLIQNNWIEYRKLLGLYAPEKQQVDVTKTDLNKLNEAEQKFLAEMALKMG